MFDPTFLLSLVKKDWFNLQPENGGSVSRFSRKTSGSFEKCLSVIKA